MQGTLQAWQGKRNQYRVQHLPGGRCARARVTSIREVMPGGAHCTGVSVFRLLLHSFFLSLLLFLSSSLLGLSSIDLASIDVTCLVSLSRSRRRVRFADPRLGAFSLSSPFFFFYRSLSSRTPE